VDKVGLTDKRRARVRTLSGGQLRRLDLALALVGDPELIFLDEPTTGFDPDARRSDWEMIANLRDLGKTVLLTSHYLDEVQQLADRVAVLSHGRLIAESAPDALGGRDTAETMISFRLPHQTRLAELPIGPWRELHHGGDEVSLGTDQPTQALLVLTYWARARGEDLDALTVTRPSLEDAYLQITHADSPAEDIHVG
jgi:ABC-2 type transport system ATP-binding protein